MPSQYSPPSEERSCHGETPEKTRWRHPARRRTGAGTLGARNPATQQSTAGPAVSAPPGGWRVMLDFSRIGPCIGPLARGTACRGRPCARSWASRTSVAHTTADPASPSTMTGVRVDWAGPLAGSGSPTLRGHELVRTPSPQGRRDASRDGRDGRAIDHRRSFPMAMSAVSMRNPSASWSVL